MPALRILVSGTVQGVGYRDWTVRAATALGLNGWVRNLTDDRVEIWAEGPADALAKLREQCHRGPRHADVKAVVGDPVDESGATAFTRRSTGSAPETITSSR